MPYTIRRRSGRWCVYKKVGDRAVGASLGCHDTRRGAIAQIGAISSAERKSIRIVRGADDMRLMFLITSNGYRDRAGEYVSVAALQQYAKMFEGGDVRPQWLDYKHKAIIGEIIAVDLWGPFLVEIAKELPGAARRWDFIEATPFLDWACSQQFIARKDEKATGVYRSIIKERSTVLRRSQAANALTGAGIIRSVK